MDRIKYILITRFNLDYKRIVVEEFGIDPDEWLKRRIDLFFEYCYPSVLSQSDKKFEWWVFFDHQTHAQVVQRIHDGDKAGIVNIKFSSWATFRDDILTGLNSIADPYDFLFNGRLDSDDVLSKNHIEGMKEFFLSNSGRFPETFVLNPLSGLVLDSISGLFYKKKLVSNAFQVLVQKNGSIENSVFTYQHQTAAKYYKVFNLSTAPFWVMVVHGGNWLNIKSGRPIVLRRERIVKYFPNLPPFKIQKKSGTLIAKEYFSYLKSVFSKVRLKLLKSNI